MSVKDIIVANTADMRTVIDLLNESGTDRSQIGNYFWKVYNKDTLEFLGYMVGSTEDEYPAAGAMGDMLYVRAFDSIEELTWAQIHEIVHSGYADSLLTPKDSKTVTLTTGEAIELEIIDFNHDTYSEGGTAPVSFFMKNCLKTTRRMNASATNSGGWDSSEMFAWLQGTFYEQLPADLKALVKPVDKISTVGDASSTLETISAKVWQLSATEAFNSVSTSYSPGGEGKLYPVFTDNTSRIKMVNGSAGYWWLRSPYAGYSTYFCYVISSGAISNYDANYAYGVAVGLCI